MGKKADRILELEQERDDLLDFKTTIMSFQNAGTAVSFELLTHALKELWGKLGVDNSTNAVERVKELIHVERAHKLTQGSELQHRQEVAKLCEDLRVHKLALRQAETDRDNAQQAHHDQSYELANSKARVQELEQAVLAVFTAYEAGDIKDSAVDSAAAFDFDMLGRLAGDLI